MVGEMGIYHIQALDNPAFSLFLYVCGSSGVWGLPPDYISSVASEAE